MEEEIQKLLARNVDQEARIQALDKRNDLLLERNDVIKEALNEYEAKVEILQKKNDDLRSQISSSGDIQRLQDELATIKRENMLLNDQVRSRKSDMDSVRSDIRPTLLDDEVKGLRAENDRLNQRLRLILSKWNDFLSVMKD